MIDNLKTASANLQVALDQYFHACNGLFATSPQGRVLSTPSEEEAQQVETELVSILSHEARIREARITMARGRNQLFSISPINALPLEVLTLIFEMIVDSQPCVLAVVYDDVAINREHTYPDLLTQVCSRWRQTVESHPSLWAHIDFMPDHGPAKLMSRAKTYAKRAQSAPLEVHIVGMENPEYNHRDLVKFLGSLAGRLKALVISVTEENISEFYSLVLETLLPKSSPGVFTQLSICSKREHRDIFITSSKSSRFGGREDSYLPVNLSPEALEGSFASLKVLDCCAVFPGWESKAYHGLIELRLTSSMDELYSHIPERDLIAILKASPRLRVLHFAIAIIDRRRGPKASGPITLGDLEELEISASYEFQERPLLEVASLLRLLAPGNKPLSLMLQTMEYGSSTSWEAIKSFLGRSNVTRFHAKDGAPLINKLLRYMPRLNELIISYLSASGPAVGITEGPLKQAIKDADSVRSPLALLSMRGSSIYLNQLRLLIELYPTKSLVIYDCNIWENKEAMKPITETQLSNDFPTVKFVKKAESSSNPDYCSRHVCNHM